MPAKISKQHNIACAAHQLVARRIVQLMRERAELEEEVRQLRAAVQIWTSVAEQTAIPNSAGGRVNP
jgi:hypothetical protein